MWELGIEISISPENGHQFESLKALVKVEFKRLELHFNKHGIEEPYLFDLKFLNYRLEDTFSN